MTELKIHHQISESFMRKALKTLVACNGRLMVLVVHTVSITTTGHAMLTTGCDLLAALQLLFWGVSSGFVCGCKGCAFVPAYSVITRPQ
jgi:hypothetical protein